MSRADKRKAANLRAKKRRCPAMSPEATQEAMARMRIREWRKANPARPMYMLLDDMAAAAEVFVSVLARMDGTAA